MDNKEVNRFESYIRSKFSKADWARIYLKAGLSADLCLDGNLTPALFRDHFFVERPGTDRFMHIISDLFKDEDYNIMCIESEPGSGKSTFIHTLPHLDDDHINLFHYIDCSRRDPDSVESDTDITESIFFDRSIAVSVFKLFRKRYRKACENLEWINNYNSLLSLTVESISANYRYQRYIDTLREVSNILSVQTLDDYFKGYFQRINFLQKEDISVLLLLYLFTYISEPIEPHKICVIIFDNIELFQSEDVHRISLIVNQISHFISTAFVSIGMGHEYYTQFAAIISVRTATRLSMSQHLLQSQLWGPGDYYLFSLKKYDYSAKAILKKIRYLVDIGGDNTPLVKRCKEIAALIVPEEQIDACLNESDNLDILKSNGIEYNHLMSLFNYNYRELIYILNEIIEGHNQLTHQAIRENFAVFALLHKIDLGYIPSQKELNQIKEITSIDLSFLSISSLRRIPEYYSTGYSKLFKLPNSICRLEKLQTLDISNSLIDSLPESIGQLISLRVLIIDRTEIRTLPPSLGLLSSLCKLSLSNTKVRELPDEIKQLTKLEYLNIQNTNIHDLPPWISILPKLQHLDLSGLTLPSIPESLTTRGLRFVEEKVFSPEAQGINLYRLNLTHQEKTVFLDAPELISELYNDQVPLRECKVVFLGDGGVGKSYTIRRIMNNGKKESIAESYHTEETHGIEISDYSHTDTESVKFTIHFWDFGGQDIYHSLHRCFLTEDTCYVVVLRTRETESTSSARYWMRTLHSFAPNSPVLLFVNCWGNSTGDRAINETKLKTEFPQIKKILFCSAKESSAEEFRAKIMNPLFDMATSADICNIFFNRKWNALRLTLQQEQQCAIREHQKNYISKGEYHKLCSVIGIADEQAVGLLTVFNNLGLCVSFHRDENHRELEEYKILNPVWLTNALYAIAEEGSNHSQEGRISFDSIRSTLHNKEPQWNPKKNYHRPSPELTYEDDECEYIIDVAEAFNLCYRIEKDTIFFPSLCKSNSPDDEAEERNVFPMHGEYRFCYDYLPDTVMHQLMIRCLKKGYAIRHCWRTGMELGKLEYHRAIVSIEDHKTLQLMLYGKDGHPLYELLPMLREDIEQINRTMDLKAKEEIVADEDVFPVLQVLKTYRKGQEEIVGNNSGKDHVVFDLLEHYFDAWTIANMTVTEDGINLTPYQYHRVDIGDPVFRQSLLKAYKGQCAYCKLLLKPFEMEVDHILPKKQKSTNDSHIKLYLAELVKRGFDLDHPDYIENFFPSCRLCNQRKSNNLRDAVTLREYHSIALTHTPIVLRLIEDWNKEE